VLDEKKKVCETYIVTITTRGSSRGARENKKTSRNENEGDDEKGKKKRGQP